MKEIHSYVSWKRYLDFIASRKQRPRPLGYVESHHIIPSSLGGVDDNCNLVILTAREHFICHWLLWKALRSSSMIFAFSRMCGYTGDKPNRKAIRDYRVPSSTYEALRKDKSKAHSVLQISRMEDPAYRSSLIKQINSESARNNSKRESLIAWKSESLRSSHRVIMKEVSNRPEVLDLKRNNAKAQWQKPEHKKSLLRKSWSRYRVIYVRALGLHNNWVEMGKPCCKTFEKKTGLKVGNMIDKFKGTDGYEVWDPNADEDFLDWLKSQ